MLPNDKKAMIAGELDRSVREIERKISVCAPILVTRRGGGWETQADFLLAGYAHTGSLLIGYLLMIIKYPPGV